MPVSKTDVLKIAELSRLDIPLKRFNTLQQQLEQIIVYMNRLDEVETDDVVPLAHPQDLVNAWREDIPKPSLPLTEVLKNAPQSNESFFSVPKVIQK